MYAKDHVARRYQAKNLIKETHGAKYVKQSAINNVVKMTSGIVQRFARAKIHVANSYPVISFIKERTIAKNVTRRVCGPRNTAKKIMHMQGSDARKIHNSGIKVI